MWSLALARVGRTSGAEKFSSPTTKCFFDSIDPSLPNRQGGIPCPNSHTGQRSLNGPQTTGRGYRNLSQPSYAMVRDDDVPVPMRDGVTLLADAHRPTATVLIAACRPFSAGRYDGRGSPLRTLAWIWSCKRQRRNSCPLLLAVNSRLNIVRSQLAARSAAARIDQMWHVSLIFRRPPLAGNKNDNVAM